MDMKYFAAYSKMLDVETNNRYREDHVDYLKKLGEEGYIFAKGKFSDGAGGLVIYEGNSLEDVKRLVEGDPYIIQGARSYEIHPWDMNLID
jgi:uncharacterized protein